MSSRWTSRSRSSSHERSTHTRPIGRPPRSLCATRHGRRSRRACFWRTPRDSPTSPCSSRTRRCTCASRLVPRSGYSGEGINLVQFVIEQQKGRPLDQLMQEALFTPLGMTRTGLIFRTEFADNVADRYDANEQFKSQTKRFPARGAGSMTTSADDLARFVSALFSGRIIQARDSQVDAGAVHPDPIAAPVRPRRRRARRHGGARRGTGLRHADGACSHAPASGPRSSRRATATGRRTT